MTVRLLFLAPQPFFQLRGACLAHLRALTELAGLGADVEVISLPGGTDPELPPSVRMIRLPRLPWLSDIRIGPSWLKFAWAAPMLAAAAWRLWRGKHRVVVASEDAAFVAAILKPFFGFRLVYDMDDVLSRRLAKSGWTRSAPFLAAVRSAEGLMLRRADAVVTNSADTTEAAEAVAGIERVHFYHHAPEAEPIPPPDDPQARAALLYAGNLEPYQGVDLLLRAMAEVHRRRPEARLDVVGGSPEQSSRLALETRKLGISGVVRFLGLRPLPETLARMRIARALISPMTQEKAVPMKLYAYMNSGTPIVATALPNHTQLLDEDCAVLVAPAPRALAEGILRLLDDPLLGRRLSEEALRRRRALSAPEECRRAFAAACGLR